MVGNKEIYIWWESIDNYWGNMNGFIEDECIFVIGFVVNDVVY